MNELREKVQVALTEDKRTQDTGIEIVNNNGVITLGGKVPEREISEAAESIAERVEGVVSVVNEIHVRKDRDEDPYDVSGTLDEDVVVK